MAKRNSTSAIWQYVGFKREDDLQTQVLCRTCRAVVATSRGNTTNPHHQLLNHHKELHEQFKAGQSGAQTLSSSKVTRPSLRQQSIAQSFVSATPYEKSSKRHIEITEAITHCLAKDMMPINTVARPGFLSLVHKLDRRYEVPSRNYFSNLAIPNLYEKCRTTVESEPGPGRVLCLHHRLVQPNHRALHQSHCSLFGPGVSAEGTISPDIFQENTPERTLL